MLEKSGSFRIMEAWQRQECDKVSVICLCRKGEEEDYNMLFFPLEGNVLKIHRAFPASNSRRLREAIALALFDINLIL